MRSLFSLVYAIGLFLICFVLCGPVSFASPQFDKTSMINAKIEAAKSHIENENFDAAKVLLNSVLKLDPQNSQARQLLQQCEPVSISVSNSELSFSQGGGTLSLRVNCSTDWSISIYPLSWTRLSRSGDNLKVTVSANNTYAARTDSFELKARNKTVTVKIFQSAQTKKVRLSASTSSLEFCADGGTTTVDVSASDYWYVGDFVPYWISTSGISANGNKLIVTVDKNTSSQSRKGTIRLQTYDSRFEIQVFQEAAYSAPFKSSGTTWVPTCTGLGRKYLRDAVDERGKCQMGALLEDGTGVVVYGGYGYARTAGLPSGLNSAIDKIYAQKYKFKSIAYSTLLGYYCVVYGRNGWIGVVPDGMKTKLDEYNANYDEIKCVSINQFGNYVVISDKYFVASNQEHREAMIYARDKYGSLKYVCITDLGICVVCENGVYYKNVPSALADKLKKISFVPDRVVFTDCGSYLITNEAGNYTYHM